MSFGRRTSFSGFGATSGNAFGAGAAAGGGQSNTPTGQTATAGPSFSFGGAATAAQPQQQQQQQQQQQPAGGGGLFSFGPTPAQQQQTAGGGLFGAPKPAAGSGGLFGQQQQAQQQQPNQNGLGSSLFGQAGQTQNKPPTLSLFGAQPAAPAKAASSFGGFGQQQQQQQPQQQQQQQQQQPSFSFGITAQSQPQQQQQQPGLFGQSQANNQQQLQQNNAFAQSNLGGTLQQQNQINSSSPFARQPYRQKERFNDLADVDKKLFEEMEKFLHEQMRIKDELSTREYAGEMRKRTAAWNELSNGVQSTLLILQQDGDMIKGITDQVESDRTHLATLYDVARNAKEGRSDGKQWAAWPGDFFTKAAVAFRERIKRYRSTVEEIERQLATIDTRNEHSPQLISDAIVHQNAIFMSLASNVASLHGEMEELKREFAQWYQQSHRSAVDPFAMSQLTSTL